VYSYSGWGLVTPGVTFFVVLKHAASTTPSATTAKHFAADFMWGGRAKARPFCALALLVQLRRTACAKERDGIGFRHTLP
jgi:hypothetical protein